MPDATAATFELEKVRLVRPAVVAGIVALGPVAAVWALVTDPENTDPAFVAGVLVVWTLAFGAAFLVRRRQRAWLDGSVLHWRQVRHVHVDLAAVTQVRRWSRPGDGVSLTFAGPDGKVHLPVLHGASTWSLPPDQLREVARRMAANPSEVAATVRALLVAQADHVQAGLPLDRSPMAVSSGPWDAVGVIGALSGLTFLS